MRDNLIDRLHALRRYLDAGSGPQSLSHRETVSLAIFEIERLQEKVQEVGADDQWRQVGPNE